LCKGDFLASLKEIALRKPFSVLLREKDLPFDKYLALSREVFRICEAQGVPLIAHTHPVPGLRGLHVPMALAGAGLAQNYTLSVSVHSAQEATRAEAMGAAFVIAGHVFSTRSKQDMPPRGLEFLKEVCDAVRIPVFAVGGITDGNAMDCVRAGAAGVCRMSYWMESADV